MIIASNGTTLLELAKFRLFNHTSIFSLRNNKVLTAWARKRGPADIIFLPVLVILCLCWHPSTVDAFQEAEKFDSPVPGVKLINPKSMGLDIPAADIMVSPFKIVKTRDETGELVVAKVHVQVGENFVLLMPHGELVARTPDQIQPVEEGDAFEPASHDAIAERLLSGKLDGFKYEETRNYVFIYNTSDGFFRATKKILESMCVGVERYMNTNGIETHDPEVPLVVIMFQRRDQFLDYERMPDGVLAYYDIVANHIVLHEESALMGTRPDLAEGQLLSTIAHEGAHQILHNIGVQQRLSVWPMWVGEGIAEYLAPTEISRSNRWKGAGKINDLRMWELEMFLQIQYIKGFNGDSIEGAILDRKLDSTGYATAWSIIHYLARHRKKDFFDYIQLLSQMSPLHGMSSRDDQIPENLEQFQEFFGKDMTEIELEMVDHMSKQDYDSPVATFPHYVCTVEYNGKQHACFFHKQDLVLKWREAVETNMTTQERRRAVWDVKIFEHRGLANRYIKQWLK